MKIPARFTRLCNLTSYWRKPEVRFALVFLMAATAAVAADLPFSSPATVGELRFSSDGKSVVGVCEDGVVRSWDVETGAIRSSVRLGAEKLRAMALSNDAMKAAASDKTGVIRVWDLKTGEMLKVLEDTIPAWMR